MSIILKFYFLNLHVKKTGKMQKARRLIKYILYLITARHKFGFGVHSPFLYKIITDVICDINPYYAMDDIWEIRQNLLADNRKIKVNDFGAGSQKLKSEERKISEIVKYSSVKVKYGELLFRLVNYFKPQNIIELGTSVGLGTLYLALPNKSASVKTIEGCPNISEVAKSNFEQDGIKNIKQFTGNFDDILPKIINETECIDFVYFDGNHKKEPTLRYFESFLLKLTIILYLYLMIYIGLKIWNRLGRKLKSTRK